MPSGIGNCRLSELGISPVTKDAAGASKFSFVLFSAPPSGSADYLGEVCEHMGPLCESQ
jgi:hypothetical protein